MSFGALTQQASAPSLLSGHVILHTVTECFCKICKDQTLELLLVSLIAKKTCNYQINLKKCSEHYFQITEKQCHNLSKKNLTNR